MKSLFTRDSQLWNVIAGAGAVAVALSTLTNPAEYGVPAVAVPYLRLFALIVTVASAKAATSPLPHSEEGDAKITPSGK